MRYAVGSRNSHTPPATGCSPKRSVPRFRAACSAPSRGAAAGLPVARSGGAAVDVPVERRSIGHDDQVELLRNFVHRSLELAATRGVLYREILDLLDDNEEDDLDSDVYCALGEVGTALHQVVEVRGSLKALGPAAFADHFDVYLRFVENLERRAAVLRSLDDERPETARGADHAAASNARLLRLARELRDLTSEAHDLTAELTLELLEAREPGMP
jgi:hypothetical protein